MNLIQMHGSEILVAVIVAILGVLGAITAHRINKLSDDRAERKAAAGMDRATTREMQKYLHFMRTARLRRKGPPRWAITRSSVSSTHVQIEHRGRDIFDLRVDMFITKPRPEIVTKGGTIRLKSVPQGLPIDIPVGTPSRARETTMLIRWEDEYGSDQGERMNLSAIF
ncbi:hypothetical protein [Agreia sp. Leaf283]|uniref:hypothetical protein n=1 Tax=Agreia sp. Leaf283 TaxID=1736321 RepID=UPI0012FCA0E6|nr:hypothetical protein [Agreia sp. Leaf283]